MEERVVLLRKELADAGLDHGATTIQWHLGRQRLRRVPSVATVHRILVRRGLVIAEPRKRPKGSWRRFEAPAPNECWQIDATDWVAATGVVRIFNLIDDYSRVAVGSRAVREASTVEAWTSFVQAAEQWGLPAGTLSDNGLCFSGKLRGSEVLFESNLREAGVRPLTGRPFHPQTTGKVERFQQTLKTWLRKQPLADDTADLQAQLDRFRHIYNYERPHQGIGRITPYSRWTASPAAQPAPHPLEHPHHPSRRQLVHHATVLANGTLNAGVYIFHVGSQWVGNPATILTDDHYATVFINRQLVRHQRIDPNRRYQPSGLPRGRRPNKHPN
jgi:transposase InsO family protein